MSLEVGVVMDPIAAIKPHKDSTLAMLIEVQRRGWAAWYMEPGDLFLLDGAPNARMRRLLVEDDTRAWFELGEERSAPLSELDVILMRRDPPFDIEYIYTTYLLEAAERRGVLVVNRACALRDLNEKLAIGLFPSCTPPTLVSRQIARLAAFAAEHEVVVVKPLDSMGGTGVLKVARDDPNFNALLEMSTAGGTRTVMAQRFIPEIALGDKRILLVGSEPVPKQLVRVPADGDFRGNLAVAAAGSGAELGERERWICRQVGPALAARGIMFAGLDVIGDYLTEINVTSPTGIRELDAIFSLNISGLLMDEIESRLERPAIDLRR